MKTAGHTPLMNPLENGNKMMGPIDKQSIIVKGYVRDIKLPHPMVDLPHNLCRAPLGEVILQYR